MAKRHFILEHACMVNLLSAFKAETPTTDTTWKAWMSANHSEQLKEYEQENPVAAEQEAQMQRRRAALHYTPFSTAAATKLKETLFEDPGPGNSKLFSAIHR